MAEVPADYDSGPDEEEGLGPETSPAPGPLKMPEDAAPGTMAEAGLQLRVETQRRPQPETEDEGAPGIVPPNLKPSGRAPGEVLTEPERALSRKTEPGAPQEVKVKAPRETRGLFMDLEVPMDENLEEPGLKPPEETKPDVTEGVLIESANKTDPEPPKEAEPEVPRATISETRLELLEETSAEVREESLGEQYEETGLKPREEAKPTFSSEIPGKSIEEADLQPPKMTTSESPEVTGRKSPQEERTTLEFTEEKPHRSGEKGLEIPKETKQKVPKEMKRKSTGERETEPSEQTRPEFLKEKARKSTEEADLEPPEETKPEVPEETGGKSAEEKAIEPSEQTKPSKSTEETQGKSAEEKGLEPPEHTTADFPKKEPKTSSKSTEETGHVPPQKTKPGVQEKTQTEPTGKKDLELPDKTKPLLRRETHKEFAKEDMPEPIKFKHFVDEDKLVKETKMITKDSMLGPLTGKEVDAVNTEVLEEPPKPYDLDSYPCKSRKNLRESYSEKKAVDVALKWKKLVHTDKEKTQPKKKIELQFEYLKWSPEKVAEWISELGFPQYKECFTTNFISGRKLIHVNCSNLPQMGITDFEDMKVISRRTRELLGIEEPLFSRSIRLPYRDNIGLFLEQKGHSGVKSDSLTFSEFVKVAGLQDYAPQ